MDNMVIILILMLSVFVGLYLFLTNKIDQTDLSGKLIGTNNKSDKLKMTKFELDKKRIKYELFQLFEKLDHQEQLNWVDELQQIILKNDQEKQK